MEDREVYRLSVFQMQENDHGKKGKNNNWKTELSEHTFKTRDSYITQLLTEGESYSPSSSALYNFFLIFGAVIIISSILADYNATGKIILGFELIAVAFHNFHVAFLIWLGMMFQLYLSFICFQCWFHHNRGMKKKEEEHDMGLKIWNVTWIILTVIFYAEFIYFPLHFLRTTTFGVATKFALYMEQARLLMKIHSYIVTKAKLSNKNNPTTFCEDLSMLSYFLFAPTLLYRDEYPRNKKTNWKMVTRCVLEFVFFLYVWVFMHQKQFIDRYKDFGKEFTPWTVLLEKLISNAIPVFYMVCIAFFMLFHDWMNFWAEILRFGDRKFYANWLISMNVGQYLRYWNLIVYDWLYAHIYVDFASKCLPQGLAKFAVVFVSAFFHEYILTVSLGSCLWVVYLAMILTAVMNLIRFPWMSQSMANFLIISALLTGFNLFGNIYYVEYYARINCPIEGDPWLDFIMPRYLICNLNKMYALQ